MPNDHRTFDDDDWTASELAQLETLGSARAPRAGLKRRTIDALRARALLRPARFLSPPTLVAMAAAASIIFSAGAFAGYATATHRAAARTPELVAPAREVARADSTATAVPPKRQVVWF